MLYTCRLVRPLITFACPVDNWTLLGHTVFKLDRVVVHGDTKMRQIFDIHPLLKGAELQIIYIIVKVLKLSESYLEILESQFWDKINPFSHIDASAADGFFKTY